MTTLEIVFISLALALAGAFFLLLIFLIKQNSKISQIISETQPMNNSLLLFSRELGELKEASRNVEVLRENIARAFKEQDLRLKPIDEGMTHLISYFGTLKKNAGKVGELTFDLLVEQMPPGTILRNITFQNQMRLEFLLEIGGEWVPVDSKFTKNPKIYFKKAVHDVSEKYVGQKVLTAGKNPAQIDVNKIETASFGLIFFPSDEVLFEVYKSEEMRRLMIEKRVWAVSPSNFYWQLFYFKWMENQSEQAGNAMQILKSMNMGLVEAKKSLETLDLVEKQMGQALINVEKSKKSLIKISENFKESEELDLSDPEDSPAL